MNCWNRSVRRFFFGFGSGGGSGRRCGRISDWKVTCGMVIVLSREELLSVEVTNDMSISGLSLDDPRQVVEDGEVSVSSSFQGVRIEFV